MFQMEQEPNTEQIIDYNILNFNVNIRTLSQKGSRSSGLGSISMFSLKNFIKNFLFLKKKFVPFSTN